MSTPAPPLPKSRWLVRGSVYGLLGGALNGVVTALMFGPRMARQDAAFDGVTDFMLVTARGGVQVGLFYGVVFGLLAWWLVGTAHRPRRTMALALGVQAPLNILFALGLASLWTFVSLIVTPVVLTVAGVAALLAHDARTLTAAEAA
ncbi:MAG TPA: hypothetical protein VJ976_02950 [Ornithinimicrobium sp.]|uniref:hypothetical protein n=1 Tax=Ornithinimicrobium sp. TaxID=1977084 RepID=UPI002B4990F9|nr:hypothetical protein [Ornithinimicrobium sp.]HKJ11327.1 hypothetical protein [Ornithinimicrobium sp.]